MAEDNSVQTALVTSNDKTPAPSEQRVNELLAEVFQPIVQQIAAVAEMWQQKEAASYCGSVLVTPGFASSI
jgi:hypothetical protein